MKNNSPQQARLAAFEEELLAKYMAGTAISHLARDYRVETKTIRKFLKDRGVYRKPGLKTYDHALTPEEVKELYEKGQTDE